MERRLLAPLLITSEYLIWTSNLNSLCILYWTWILIASSDFLKKNNVPAPENPVMFLKPTSSYIVEGQDIIVIMQGNIVRRDIVLNFSSLLQIPKVFTRVAHEVELGVIINRKCKDVSKQDAMSYVGGYCLALDMTAQCELVGLHMIPLNF